MIHFNILIINNLWVCGNDDDNDDKFSFNFQKLLPLLINEQTKLFVVVVVVATNNSWEFYKLNFNNKIWNKC